MMIVVQVELMLTIGRLLVPDISWLITMLLLSPAVSFLAITLIVNGSAKAQTMEESQQRAIFLILPILLLIVGQFSGLILINAWLLLGLGAIFVVLDIIFVKRAVRKLNYEILLR